MNENRRPCYNVTYITCCRDCKERCAEPNCHTTCKRYLAERQKLDEANKYHRKAAYLSTLGKPEAKKKKEIMR